MAENRQTKILNISIAFSLLTHAVFLLFFQTHSVWFAPNSSSQGRSATSSCSKILDKPSFDEVLRAAFAPGNSGLSSPAFSPKQEAIFYQFAAAEISGLEQVHSLCSFPSVPIEESFSLNSSISPVRTFQLPSIEQFDLFADLPKDLIMPTTNVRTAASSYQPMVEWNKPELKTIDVLIEEALPKSIVAFGLIPTGPIQPDEVLVKANPTIPVPSLPHLPSLADLHTVNLSDSFEAELSFLPRSDGPGYVFALTLFPRIDLNLAKIKQNIIFLVDRSNSIQKDRLQATKQAIYRAMEELNGDMKFNVIAFDAKIDKLFPTLVCQTPENSSRANQFIEDISLGSLFSVPDLYKALFLTIPSRVEDDELYTAVLLTDGESLSKKQLQRSLLRDWTVQNNGRVSLYAMGIDGDPNLATLDAVCAMNKGKYIAASTNRGLKRKLMKLAKNIRSPIAKDVISRAVAQSPRAHVEIHLNASHAPHLYLDEPYVILGSTETLDDFILFVQARLKDGWLNIKKTIAFADAKKGGRSLQSQWALQNAYRNYEHYVQDDNPSHLAEAKKRLEPFNIQAIQ